MKILCSALVLLICPTSAQAAPFKCNPNGNQAELNQCALDEYVAADKKLNATWQRLMAKFKNEPVVIIKFKTAQKAWIAFRDAEVDAQFACEAQDRTCFGSMEPMLRSGVLTELTEARTTRLQQYLKDGLGVPMGN